MSKELQAEDDAEFEAEVEVMRRQLMGEPVPVEDAGQLEEGR